MKKTALLHSRISGLIAELGHGDSICIADAGLPIPAEVERIDLALCAGLPAMRDCLRIICTEMTVEAAITATELAGNAAYLKDVTDFLSGLEAEQGKGISHVQIPHDAFKVESARCRAVIRTGECTPYANIILTAGVAF